VDEDAAARCVELNGTELRGRQLRIDFAANASR